MNQLENTDNLAQLGARYRDLIVLITETGLRATDACTLAFDPWITDGAGWPCPRFTAAKMRGEHLLPLSPRALEAIRAQQRAVGQSHPDGSTWLFPSRFAPDLPVPYDTLRLAFSLCQQRIRLHGSSASAGCGDHSARDCSTRGFPVSNSDFALTKLGS
jgi:integrase